MAATARANYKIGKQREHISPKYCHTTVFDSGSLTHTLGATRLLFEMTDSARLKKSQLLGAYRVYHVRSAFPSDLSPPVTGASVLVTASYPLEAANGPQPLRVAKIGVLTLHFEGTLCRTSNRRPSQNKIQ